MVTARAWCRVDLAGGTLDLWPLGLLHPGACTVTVAIDVAATVRLARGSPRGSYRGRSLPAANQGTAVSRDGAAISDGAVIPSAARDLGAGPEVAPAISAASAAELVRHPDTALVGVVAEALALPPF